MSGLQASGLQAPAAALTPDVRGWLRGARLWLVIAGIALASAVAAIGLQGVAQLSSSQWLDPSSPRPQGSKAVLEVLRQHGVEVELATELSQAEAAAVPAASTLVLYERQVQLDQEQLQQLLDAGFARVVLIQPGPSLLQRTGAGIVTGGTIGAGEGTLPAGAECRDAIADAAPEISQSHGSLYALAPGAAGWSCYEALDRHAIVAADAGGAQIVALGAAEQLSNEQIVAHGNAAMALGLLGDQPRLVWYEPGAADLPLGEDGLPALQSLVPPWLTPAVLLLCSTAVGVMLWRGRRFGPLVTERLPVVVPAAETMTGRARLYASAGARLRAADNLRIGTLRRLATALALPSTTSAVELATAAADRAGWTHARTQAVLLDAVPATDRQLVALSDELLQLERACAGALHVPASDNRGEFAVAWPTEPQTHHDSSSPHPHPTKERHD